MLDVNVRRRDERVNAWSLRVLDGVPRSVDIELRSACQSTDDGAFDLARDRLDGLEVAGRGDRKASLDHVYVEARELMGDLQLFLPVQRDPRRLLAVAQRRVEDQDAICLAASARRISN